jgi:hypothetical protein
MVERAEYVVKPQAEARLRQLVTNRRVGSGELVVIAVQSVVHIHLSPDRGE